MLVDHLGARLSGAALRLRLAGRGLITAALLGLAYVLWGLADVIEAVSGRLRRLAAGGTLATIQTLDGWACRLEAAARPGWGPWGRPTGRAASARGALGWGPFDWGRRASKTRAPKRHPDGGADGWGGRP